MLNSEYSVLIAFIKFYYILINVNYKNLKIYYFQMTSFTNLSFVRIFICLEIIMLISTAVAQDDFKRYCGHHLTSALSLICEGQYGELNTYTEEKRSGGKIYSSSKKKQRLINNFLLLILNSSGNRILG